MKLEISTSYLEPVKLEQFEWVTVILPSGRVIEVFDDAIFVGTRDDRVNHRDGRKIWQASREPYGKTIMHTEGKAK